MEDTAAEQAYQHTNMQKSNSEIIHEANFKSGSNYENTRASARDPPDSGVRVPIKTVRGGGGSK